MKRGSKRQRISHLQNQSPTIHFANRRKINITKEETKLDGAPEGDLLDVKVLEQHELEAFLDPESELKVIYIHREREREVAIYLNLTIEDRHFWH